MVFIRAPLHHGGVNVTFLKESIPHILRFGHFLVGPSGLAMISLQKVDSKLVYVLVS
jgi:hypothetical protein